MLQPGDEVGCYIIQEYLDSGGMSKVYRARNKTEDTPVVVKEMIDHLQFDSQLVDRFVQSAKIMQQLRHPHLARVLDLIEQNGRYYVVEEYLPGGSLANIIDRKDPISERQALEWCRDALHGVDYAHQNGIIHRDLKPGNMMLDGEGKVKVTDFGIAKAFGGPRLTKTGAEMGTPAYMSPEQIRSPHHVDHLTDVYSMGVVLYELLTGEIPFDGDTEFGIKEKVVREAPVPLRRRKAAISARAESLVLKAMQKDPSSRFGGCNEFALAIDAILTGRNNESKNNWRLVAAGAVGALLLIGVLFGVIQNLHSSPDAKTPTQVFDVPRLIPPSPVQPTLKLSVSPVEALGQPGVEAGTPVTLAWESGTADKVMIDHGIGDVELSGSRVVKPTESLDYVATATARTGGLTATAHVRVNVKPANSQSNSGKFRPPQHVRIGGNVIAANLISQVMPVYPPLAKQARIQGVVVLEAEISKEGTIDNLKVVTGHPLLIQAAIDAVKQWRYKPTMLNNEPVPVVTTITVNFAFSQ
jgi:serine/threonine-protein kinase